MSKGRLMHLSCCLNMVITNVRIAVRPTPSSKRSKSDWATGFALPFAISHWSIHIRTLQHAAEAAEAAGAQGKFWEMHDLLFESQEALDDEDIARYAKTLGLDA